MWTIHQSTLVLFDATDSAATPVAIGRCKSTLEITTTQDEALVDAFGDDSRSPITTDVGYSITLANILATDLTAAGLVGPDPQPDARYTLVALAHNRDTGRWVKYEWYKVSIPTHAIDSGGIVSQVHGQNFTFNARRQAVFFGSSKTIPTTGGNPGVAARPVPDATPTPGIVLLHQGAQRIQAFTYDFTGHTFSTLEPSNISITNLEISDAGGPYTFLSFSGSNTTLPGASFIRQGRFDPSSQAAAPQNIALEFLVEGQQAAMLTADGNLHTDNLNIAPAHGLEIPALHMRLGADNVRLASTGTHIAGTFNSG